MKEGFYEDEYATVWLENGILFQVYKPNLVITLDAAKEMVKKRIEKFPGVKRPAFIDIRHLLSVDSASRNFFASKEAVTLISAGAIYLDNPLARWAGNIFLLIDKPIIPAKLFTNKELALRWLEPFKNLN